MAQMEAVRHGVHLEHIGVSVFRLTGTRTVYMVREERRKKKTPVSVWFVKENLEDKDAPSFGTAGGALAYAYVQAGAVTLEI